jgi:hypothetical protein
VRDAQGLAEDAFDGPAGAGIKLRIHHQSPAGAKPFDAGLARLDDGAFADSDPIRSAPPINADLL